MCDVTCRRMMSENRVQYIRMGELHDPAKEKMQLEALVDDNDNIGMIRIYEYYCCYCGQCIFVDSASRERAYSSYIHSGIHPDRQTCPPCQAMKLSIFESSGKCCSQRNLIRATSSIVQRARIATLHPHYSSCLV